MKKRNMSWVALLLSFVLFFAPFPTSFAAVEPYVESDTTMDFTKAQGDYYWFKFTVHGSHADPQIAAGNGTVLKTGNCKKLKMPKARMNTASRYGQSENQARHLPSTLHSQGKNPSSTVSSP